jgi:phenylalanyl-tRNA synthetase beta chain
LELKGVVEALLRNASFPDVSWQRGGGPWLDENQGAVLIAEDDSVIGVAGLLGGDESGRWGFKNQVFVAELNLQAAAAEPELPRFKTLPRFPSIAADMTLEHGIDLSFSDLERTVQEVANPLVTSVSLVGRFSGESLPPDVVRTTLRLVYRNPERSMTQDEVNVAQESLKATLVNRLDVRI